MWPLLFACGIFVFVGLMMLLFIWSGRFTQTKSKD
ncbi:hypothetical protein EV586_105249 [Tumebacillus sp. BK434]|nr:hypothetical protein EV586_105249 [Tumebacillus sp. BK434]